MEAKTVPQILRTTFLKYPKYVAQQYKNENKEFVPITYEQLYNTVLQFASGLMSIGCERGDKVGIIMDNRPEWLVCTFGLLTIGAIDVPRGTDSTSTDLSHILSIAGCKTVIAENKNALKKILQARESCPLLETLILFEKADDIPELNDFKVHYYADLLELGKTDFEKNAPDKEILKGDSEDISTIIFTSGTTGLPKGVILKHKNFLAQIPHLSKIIFVGPGRSCISVLPVWHSFERECELLCVSRATSINYSQPISSVLLPDLQKISPFVFPSVPRIWEAVYDAIFKLMKKEGGLKYKIFKAAVSVGTVWKENQLKLLGRWLKVKKSERITQPLSALLPTIFLFPIHFLFDCLVFKAIRKKLGSNFKYGGGVSGGAGLPRNIDIFFAAAGVNLVEGYGLTETAPVICCRDMRKPIFGTVGRPLDCLKVKIVDKSGNEVPQGEEGEIWVSGDTVMAGYYNNEVDTKAALTSDGWFRTGDIGLLTIDGMLVLRGRLKDTIVLRGGENIEPVPIEMKLQESQFISTAVVVGQDQRNLGALILVDEVSLTQWLKEQNLSFESLQDAVSSEAVQSFYANEIRNLISAKTGFKSFEMIAKFKLLTKKFEQGVELSAKAEIMRKKIAVIYENEIKGLFEI